MTTNVKLQYEITKQYCTSMDNVHDGDTIQRQNVSNDEPKENIINLLSMSSNRILPSNESMGKNKDRIKKEEEEVEKEVVTIQLEELNKVTEDQVEYKMNKITGSKRDKKRETKKKRKSRLYDPTSSESKNKRKKL
jgi:hypothetical protein